MILSENDRKARLLYAGEIYLTTAGTFRSHPQVSGPAFGVGVNVEVGRWVWVSKPEFPLLIERPPHKRGINTKTVHSVSSGSLQCVDRWFSPTCSRLPGTDSCARITLGQPTFPRSP